MCWKMLDAIVTVLIDKLVDILLNEGRLVIQFHEQFKTIKKELLFMQSYLKDCNRVRMRDRKETLKIAVEELRELLYEAEDVIADCELFLKRQRSRRTSKYMNYCSPSRLKLRYQIGNRLQEINKEIKNQRERMASYLNILPNKERVDNSRTAIYPVLTSDDDIVGLENDYEKIKQWITEAHGMLTVIGIVGMGGIGKTTLAEKISNCSSVKECFYQVLFVTVSQNFDFAELIKGILRKLNVMESLSNRDVRDLLQQLQKKLDNKKHLLILDDVWEVDEGRWWESLKSAFPKENNGSCVIVTTRNEQVARKMEALYIHNPEILSENDSWSLFSRIAFAREGGQCPNSNLETVGKDIISKCGGLPLMIKIVAGTMLDKRHSIHEWKRISAYLQQEHQDYEAAMSKLELSYEELPMHLKPCLLCFGVFPEDHQVYFKEIVLWWIGEGFVRGRNERTALQIGEEYFNELVSRCLLLGVDKNVTGRYISCRVHDMVRDMILKIANEERFMEFTESQGQHSRSRRVNLPRNKNTKFFGTTNSKMLRTITGVDIDESFEFGRNVGLILSEMKSLRVLNLSFKTELGKSKNEFLFKWLYGLQSLPHLVCLRIRNSTLDELPNSFGNLYNLQILDLSYCRYLKRLPNSVTTLKKLISLNILCCIALEYLPKGIGELPNLQRLLGFRPSRLTNKDGCRVSNLKRSMQLQELFLEISSEDQIEKGELNVLSELKQLTMLTMCIQGTSETIIPTVDYELTPLLQLQELRLYNYNGERTSAWLNPACLPSLRSLLIYNSNITHLSPGFFGTGQESKFWQLEVLVLQFLDNLEEEWPSMHMALPSLRLLKIYRCHMLKSLPDNMVMVRDGYNRYQIWRKEEEIDDIIETS